MNHVIHALSSTEIRVFSPEMSKVQYIKKIQIEITFWYIISNSFNFFFESLRTVLTKMITILMMSRKLSILGLLKIKAF